MSDYNTNNTQNGTNGKRKPRVDDDSITFSIRAHPGDTVAKRYTLARLIGVAVSSPFRRDLGLYDILLSQEEEAMTTRERKSFVEAVRTLALNAAIRSENVPDRADLIRYLKLAGKDALTPLVSNATTLRLFLIVDRAREHAGRIESASSARNGGAHPHPSDLMDTESTTPMTPTTEVSDATE
jgi:hypothetical protein